jgi:hypothetical protein
MVQIKATIVAIANSREYEGDKENLDCGVTTAPSSKRPREDRNELLDWTDAGGFPSLDFGSGHARDEPLAGGVTNTRAFFILSFIMVVSCHPLCDPIFCRCQMQSLSLKTPILGFPHFLIVYHPAEINLFSLGHIPSLDQGFDRLID